MLVVVLAAHEAAVMLVIVVGVNGAVQEVAHEGSCCFLQLPSSCFIWVISAFCASMIDWASFLASAF